MPVNVNAQTDLANKNENIQSFAGSNAREMPQVSVRQGDELQEFKPKASVPQNLDTTVELASYSEQIIGDIRDIAPGIPNQDEVLYQQQRQQHQQLYNNRPLQSNSQFTSIVNNPMGH